MKVNDSVVCVCARARARERGRIERETQIEGDR